MRLHGVFEVDCSRGRIVFNPDVIKRAIYKLMKCTYNKNSNCNMSDITNKCDSKIIRKNNR